MSLAAMIPFVVCTLPWWGGMYTRHISLQRRGHMAHIDLGKLNSLVEARYLSVQKHPTQDLLIYNYTPKAQYEHYWTDETLMCRGLIVRPDGTLVSLPLKKFFNLEEMQEGTIPVEPFEITEKMDGSLGVSYFVNGKMHIATRGSFVSTQSQKANELLRKYHCKYLNPAYTYLFEILFPENRIVVNYGDREELVLLTVVETETGLEIDIHNPMYEWPFPVVKAYNGITDFAELKKLEEPNKEGFVIRFQSGLRLKCKFSEYVRLHRILTQCTARTIWELLRSNEPFDAFLDRVPDEFYAWVKHTREDLQRHFAEIEKECRSVVESVEHLPTRKEQAMLVTKSRCPGIVFSMLDKKNYHDAIWKLLYPEATRPFIVDEEG